MPGPMLRTTQLTVAVEPASTATGASMEYTIKSTSDSAVSTNSNAPISA